MRILFVVQFVLLAFMSVNANAFENLYEQATYFQELFGNPPSNTAISNSDYNQGETRPKAVLKGVFYFGGSNVRRDLLSSSFRTKICNDGFSKVYSVYNDVNTTISCKHNNLSYARIGQAALEPRQGDNVYELLANLYDIIQANGRSSAVYLHCYYGVHASNTIAQMVLMQFCGISEDEAIHNWDKVDLYDSLGREGTQLQFQKIRNFTPYPEFAISDEQRRAICY